MSSGQKGNGDNWTKEVAFLSTRKATKQSWRLETPQKQIPGYTDVWHLTNTVKLKVMLTYKWMKERNKRKLKEILEQCWKSKFNKKTTDSNFPFTKEISWEVWTNPSKMEILKEPKYTDFLTEIDKQKHNISVEIYWFIKINFWIIMRKFWEWGEFLLKF